MQDTYRPTTWEEVVGQPTDEIRRLIDGHATPNFLFHGPPGTGKTTAARLIADDLGAEVVEINASDERGIDDVRGRIPDSGQTTLSGAPRVVLLDEMEGLTLDAQQALRAPMEESASVFVLATNETDAGAGLGRPDLDGIHAALVSRCTPFEFGPVSDAAIRTRIEQVADRDGVGVGDREMKMVVSFANGDVRAAIQRYKQVARGVIAEEGATVSTDGQSLEAAARAFNEGD